MVEQRTLTLVVCAAPLAERTSDTARALVEAGWRVRVVVTLTARDWIPVPRVEAVLGSPIVTAQRRFGEPRLWPEDVATVVAPLSFNTMNKWALGISDNYALGVLNESISLHRRTIAVPMIGERFWDHPARRASLDVLRSAGVRFLDPVGSNDELAPVPSEAAAAVSAAFAPERLVRSLAE